MPRDMLVLTSSQNNIFFPVSQVFQELIQRLESGTLTERSPFLSRAGYPQMQKNRRDFPFSCDNYSNTVKICFVTSLAWLEIYCFKIKFPDFLWKTLLDIISFTKNTKLNSKKKKKKKKKGKKKKKKEKKKKRKSEKI